MTSLYEKRGTQLGGSPEFPGHPKSLFQCGVQVALPQADAQDNKALRWAHLSAKTVTAAVRATYRVKA